MNRSTLAVLGVFGAALLVVGLMVARTTSAAFTAQTSVPDNSLRAGTLALSDDVPTQLFSTLTNAGNLNGGESVVQCVVVRYDGTIVPSDVRLYTADVSDGTSLAPYLDVLVERGTGGVGGDCTGFGSPTPIFGTDPTPANNTLSALAAHFSYDTGLPAFTASADPTSFTFRVTITVHDDAAAQGLTATLDLIWEARSS